MTQEILALARTDGDRAAQATYSQEPREVRIINAGLAERPDGQLVLRGSLDLETIGNLLVDSYQRKPLETKKVRDMRKAAQEGKALPAITLGLRGSNFRSEGPKADTVIVSDPCYIVDGLQRITALKGLIERISDFKFDLGCEMFFGTDYEWEKAQFKELNSKQNKMSPNIMLRNEKDANVALLTLYGLSTNEKDFALYERVQWEQTRARGELTTALTLAKIAGRLHFHKGPGASNSISDICSALLTTSAQLGLRALRENIKQFFDVVDDCWGIRAVRHGDMAPQVRSTFLLSLAEVFSAHTDFWKGSDQRVLFVETSLRRKLKGFSLHDPAIAHLTASAGKAGKHLAQLIIEHINSGKRTKRLTRRVAVETKAART